MKSGMLKVLSMALFIAGLAGTSAVMAQDKNDKDAKDGIKTVSLEERRGKNQEKMIREMTEKLGLTAGQQKQLAEIVKANSEKMKTEMKERREKGKDMRREMDKAIEDILTPEQKVKFKDFRKARKSELGKKPRGMGRQMEGPGVRGKVESIDAATQTLTIKNKEKTEMVTVPAEIEVKKAGEAILFAEIAPGDMVMAGYKEENGKKTAISLSVMPKRGPGPEGKGKSRKPREEK